MSARLSSLFSLSPKRTPATIELSRELASYAWHGLWVVAELKPTQLTAWRRRRRKLAKKELSTGAAATPGWLAGWPVMADDVWRTNGRTDVARVDGAAHFVGCRKPGQGSSKQVFEEEEKSPLNVATRIATETWSWWPKRIISWLRPTWVSLYGEVARSAYEVQAALQQQQHLAKEKPPQVE